MHANEFTSPLMYAASVGIANDFVAGLFAHDQQLNQLIDCLHQIDSEEYPAHQVLLGVSGIGKSNFLQQLKISVEKHAKLSSQWWPILITEPQIGVGNLADFWQNCLHILIENSLNIFDQAGLERLRAKIRNLPAGNAALALVLLLNQVRKQNKRLLLLIDDIDLLLNRSKEISVEFFIALQNAVDLELIGTGSIEYHDLDFNETDYSSILQIIEFNGLQKDALQEAMHQLGDRNYSPGTELYLNKNPLRIPKLHRLTGGNPRTITLIHSLISAGVDGDIRYKLFSMLDAITPVYLARMNRLSLLSQGIVEKISAEWNPVTLSQLASHFDLSSGEITSGLADLERHGFIEAAMDEEAGEERVFEMKEQLFYIWFLMYTGRSNRPGSLWLVRFLQEFFDLDELEERARIHIRMPALDRRELDYVLALSRALENRPLRDALEFSVLNSLIDDGVKLPEFRELFYWEEGDRRLFERVEHIGRFKTIEQGLIKALSKTMIVVQPFRDAFMGSPTLTGVEKAELVEQMTSYTKEKWAALEDFLMDEVERWRHMLGHHTVTLYKSIASGEMSSLSDTEGAESASEHWQDPLIAAISSAAWIDSVNQPGTDRLKPIEEIFRRSIEADPDVAIVWNSLGNLLHFHLPRFAEAEEAYLEAIKVDPEYTAAWSQLASLLNNHMERYEDAELAYLKTIELDPDNPTMYNNFAWFLYRQMDRLEDALTLSARARELNPHDLYSIHTQATLLVKYGDWHSAEPLIRHFVEHANNVPEQVLWQTGIALFQEVVRAGYVQETIAILDEYDAIDQWHMVKQALQVVVSEDPIDLSNIDENTKVLVQNIMDNLTREATK